MDQLAQGIWQTLVFTVGNQIEDRGHDLTYGKCSELA
jgi:hypothetical protein